MEENISCNFILRINFYNIVKFSYLTLLGTSYRISTIIFLILT